MREQLLDAAASMLEAAKEDLVLNDGRVMVRGVQGKSVSYADVVRWTKTNTLLGYGIFVSGSGPDGSNGLINVECDFAMSWVPSRRVVRNDSMTLMIGIRLYRECTVSGSSQIPACRRRLRWDR